MTTGRVLALVLLALAVSIPGAAADHTDASELRCDGGDGLDPDARVLVTTVGDRPRAYPIDVMNYFETIEEHLGGEPVVVTYCPLCGSGIVFSREIGNRTLTLYNSG